MASADDEAADLTDEQTEKLLHFQVYILLVNVPHII